MSRAAHSGPRQALTEEGAEHAPQNGVGERGEQGGEFADGAQDQHDNRTILHHAAAAHLPEASGGATTRDGMGGFVLGVGPAQTQG